MKTLKVKAVYLMAYKTFEDVTADLPRFIDEVYDNPQTPLRTRLSEPRQYEEPSNLSKPPPEPLKGALHMSDGCWQSCSVGRCLARLDPTASLRETRSG